MTVFPDFSKGDKLFASQMDQITGAINALEVAFVSVPSIAALRTIATPAAGRSYGTPQLVSGYYAQNDGGGGVFYWDDTSFSADDGGTIIKPQDRTLGQAGRWVRDTSGPLMSPHWWGAKGDFSSDDTVPMQACATAAALTGKTMFLLPKSYRIGAPMTLTTSINVAGCGNGSGPSAAYDDFNSSPASRIYCDFANPTCFSITTPMPCTFRDFQINVTVAFRASASGAGISISAGAGTLTNRGTQIDNVAFINLYRGVYAMKPNWWTIDNCMFRGWVQHGIIAETDGTAEGSLGWVTRCNFQGSTGSGQASCIWLGCGYTVVQNCEMVGSQVAVRISVANYEAGYIQVFDNTIEEQYYYGVLATANGVINCSMLDVQRNEFSSVDTAATYLASVYTDDTPARKWLSLVNVCKNKMRHNGAVSAGYIRIAAAANGRVQDNTAENINVGADAALFVVVDGVNNQSCLSTGIEVYDNKITGRCTTRYRFSSQGSSVLRDITGMAFAALPGNIMPGSQVYVTDGQRTSSTDSTLASGGTGAMAFRQASAWKTLL